MPPPASHYVRRASWLRAAVLGANDGIISTASLIVGVAASGAGRAAILTAAGAGWAAGAMAMAAGEYVSVSSQADSEAADLERERLALETEPETEFGELVAIYERRGISHELAEKVAHELMRRDPLAAHARDELGLGRDGANPILAAMASAVSFSAGALLPTLAAMLAPTPSTIAVTSVVTLVALAALGALGAGLGGAPPLKPSIRVTFWGALALGVTSAIGALIGRAL